MTREFLGALGVKIVEVDGLDQEGATASGVYVPSVRVLLINRGTDEAGKQRAMEYALARA